MCVVLGVCGVMVVLWCYVGIVLECESYTDNA